jgi:urocanate hydratase
VSVRAERRIAAQRGKALRCKGWRQEALLRMLENNLENAERPEDLVVYAALGKAARDWESYDRIVAALLELEQDETLVIQSGKPIGRFRSHPMTPVVVMATSNLVGRFATAEHFYELERKNKIMWGGLTAGDWQYIGSQGVIQGNYETMAQVAGTHFGGSLRGRLVVTAGLGGMGQAQPVAIADMLGGVALVAEVDGEKARRRLEAGVVHRLTERLDEAIRWVEEARAAKDPLSVAYIGNAAEMLSALIVLGVQPDVVTDMTSAHDALYGYHPAGMTLAEAADLRVHDPEVLIGRSLDTMATHVRAMLELKRRGVVVFDYGNNIRPQAHDRGVEDAFEIGVFTALYLRPLFSRGIGPFRWVCLGGDERDRDRIDELTLELFPDNERVRNWIPLAQRYVPLQGLPARIAWLGHGERTALALRVNDEVAAGRIGPVAFTRDHLDAAAMAHPFIMTDSMRDGTDAVADWPLLDALLLSSACADLVAIHSGGGGYAGTMTSCGVTVTADGTAEASFRLERVQTADTGLGVLRYADAGYEEAEETAGEAGLGL